MAAISESNGNELAYHPHLFTPYLGRRIEVLQAMPTYGQAWQVTAYAVALLKKIFHTVTFNLFLPQERTREHNFIFNQVEAYLVDMGSDESKEILNALHMRNEESVRLLFKIMLMRAIAAPDSFPAGEKTIPFTRELTRLVQTHQGLYNDQSLNANDRLSVRKYPYSQPKQSPITSDMHYQIWRLFFQVLPDIPQSFQEQATSFFENVYRTDIEGNPIWLPPEETIVTVQNNQTGLPFFVDIIQEYLDNLKGTVKTDFIKQLNGTNNWDFLRKIIPLACILSDRDLSNCPPCFTTKIGEISAMRVVRKTLNEESLAALKNDPIISMTQSEYTLACTIRTYCQSAIPINVGLNPLPLHKLIQELAERSWS